MTRMPSGRLSEKRADRHSEGLRQLFHVVDGDVSRLSLDMCHERAMETRLECEGVLTPITGSSQRDEVHGQYGPDTRL